MLRHSRGAFTLVELLVTIVIIGIVMSFAVGGMMVAMGASRKATTEGRIAKLDSQMAVRWESYHTRRLPIITPTGADRTTMAIYRLNAIRELMRLELPQRWTDITSDTTAPIGSAPPITPTYLTSASGYGLSASYLARYNACHVGDTPSRPTEAFQGAECLYLIVTMGGDMDSSSETVSMDPYTQREEGSDPTVGDVDGDGMKEFLDGWGNPIHFIRWAPGYFSDRQPAAPGSDPPAHDPIANHDPFDPLGVDPGAFALFPIISSAGPDEEHDIMANIPLDNISDLNNPYDTYLGGSGEMIGNFFDFDGDGTVGNDDNITNHLMGSR